MDASRASSAKLVTGIPGLDTILEGGLPNLSVNLVTGRPGTGKTILTHQIVSANLGPERRALYLTTLSEPTLKMLRYIQEFSFVDHSRIGQELIYLDIGESIREKGLADTSSLVLDKVRELKPAIVCVDSFKAIHELAANSVEIREFGFELSVNLAAWGVIAFLIGEYTDEEFQREPIFAVADSIISLRSEPHGLHNQRFLEVAKLRGSGFFGGKHPYMISRDGISVYPRIKTPHVVPTYLHPTARIASGVEELDEMLGGGLPVSSATMIAGAAGTGKTLIGLHFIGAAAKRNEPSVIVSFQENPVQFNNIAASFGWDMVDLQKRGLVEHVYDPPVELQPDIHFSRVREAVNRTGARLVFIDSLKDLEAATPDKIRYKDYIYSLVNELKLKGVTTIVTNEIPELFGPFQLSEYGVSFIADNVVLLRYLELSGCMGRALSIMKMRGSQHAKEIREFEITERGVRVLEPVRAFTGVMTGMPTVNEYSALAHLPSRARYIVETLQQSGSSEFDKVVHATGISPDRVQAELDLLQQQGFVIVVDKEGRKLFKPTL